jgi:hypothetical protein
LVRATLLGETLADLAETIAIVEGTLFPASIGEQSFAHGFAHLIRLPLERVSFLYDHFLNACLNLIAYRKAAYYNAEIAGISQ